MEEVNFKLSQELRENKIITFLEIDKKCIQKGMTTFGSSIKLEIKDISAAVNILYALNDGVVNFKNNF